MGDEIGQRSEWNPDASLDWFLLEMGPYHKGLQAFVADLNRIYTNEPALWQRDYHSDGFFWIDCADHEHSILSFVRQSQDGPKPSAGRPQLNPAAQNAIPRWTA